MNELVCANCGAAATDDVTCPECGSIADYRVSDAPAATASHDVTAAQAGTEAPGGGDPAGRPAPQAPGPEPAPRAGNAATATLSVLNLAYVFTTGEKVSVPPGGSSLLGRDPEFSEAARFLEKDGLVSRRHATIGLDEDGTPWIRDEYSLNGTFVNGERMPAGDRRTLRHEDKVRIGDVLMTIVREAPPGGGRR
ncbi:FHA domain-containing protein [Actinomadura opuntiae]|uniref:FHA domain-containing protein n=1 Tax=Actinomadura sp. OS1-43 TaxID=604315 RepID=UPI00255B38D5|nr:FHA domain-containing protein [Actinomadura sp. OS1-43]MDL4815008.1 FHA domain-containing protein [Actinomadura sp. OS1-43]